MFVLYVELRARIVIGNSLNVYVSGKLYRLERGVMHSMCFFFLYCMQQKAAARSCRMLWDVFSRKKFSSCIVNASVRCCMPFCSQQVNACCNVVFV